MLYIHYLVAYINNYSWPWKEDIIRVMSQVRRIEGGKTILGVANPNEG